MSFPRHVTIIGVGLLGGSVGLAIKARDPSIRVVGVGRRRESLDDALARGAIDEGLLEAAPAAIKQSDLVILATPVRAFSAYLRAVAPHLAAGAVVTDVGSTKAVIVRQAQGILGKGGPFVGSHPMAGSEQRGPQAARADLLEGATCIVTPGPAAPAALCRKVEQFWRWLGMNVVTMTPAAHDRAVARVSHLPHVLSALLMLLPGKADLAVAAGGFRDCTRLAAGDVEVWRDVLLTNRAAILSALDAFDDSLAHLRGLLEVGDPLDIERFLAAARKRRQEFSQG